MMREMASKDIFGEKVNPKVRKEEPFKSRLNIVDNLNN